MFTFFGSNPPENNEEPVPAKSELVQLCGCVGYLLWFPPNLSCLQNNPPENNVEQFPPNLSCLQNNPPENNVEDLAGTRFTLFSSRLVWDRFLLDLRNFLALVLGTNWCTTISTTGPLYAKSSNFYAKLNVSNLKRTVLVFLASVLECHHISYFEKWKLWAIFFGRFLCWWNYDRKKLRQKKSTMLVYLVLWGNSFWCYVRT